MQHTRERYWGLHSAAPNRQRGPSARSFSGTLALAGLFALLALNACTCGSAAGAGVDGGSACSRDRDCSGGSYCVSGACVACRADTDCVGTETCQAGVCTVPCTATNQCGAGGSCCPGGEACVGQQCLPQCGGVRCGRDQALCCGAGEVCEGGRCLADCGGFSRCGVDLEACCGSNELCYGVSCTQATQRCAGQIDCAVDQICERDLGVCIDRSAVGSCEYHPPTGVFSPNLDCQWTPNPGDLDPKRVDVVMAPVVGNLSDDNGDGKTDTFDTPDIAFVSYDLVGQGCCNKASTLRIVDGRCQPDGSLRTLASLNTPALDNSGGLALGDLDGDGVMEIVGARWDPAVGGGKPQGMVAFKRSSDDGSAWSVYWENTTYPTWGVHSRGGAQPEIVNFDAKGGPEVVVGNVVLNGQDGSLIWDGLAQNAGPVGIGNNAFLGPVSTVADLDLDGVPELIAGNTVYNQDGSARWTYPYTTNNSRCGGALPCDGYDAVGNFDADPEGEVVIVRRGEIFVLQDDGSLLRRIPIPVDNCPYNESGPPTIADFDGDGRAEIGTAAGDFYVVADLDCKGTPLPTGCEADGILWAVPNEDCSSRVTASSVFDFDGDGRAEVVYADETSFRIFDGSSGQVLYTDNSHHSHTRLEEPIIVDVDNDGNAEVILAENRSGGGTTPGVRVIADAGDNWVFTRRIWNEHAYHVGNVSERGEIPVYEAPTWADPASNNFRQNVQGEGLFWAPDLVIRNLVASCDESPTLHLDFELMNQGSRMVPAGVPVTIFLGPSVGTTLTSTQALIPGQREAMHWDWAVPDAVAANAIDLKVLADNQPPTGGIHNECEQGGEDNNEASLAGIVCATIIP